MQYFVRANRTETHISVVIYGSLDELFKFNLILHIYDPSSLNSKISKMLIVVNYRICQHILCRLVRIEPLILASFTVTYRSYILLPLSRIPPETKMRMRC